MVGLTLNGKTINEAEVKVLAVLDYMFHGSCRKVSKVLSLALELIRKSAVHYLARRVYSERSLRSLGIGGVWLLMRLSYVSNHTYTYGLL